ncbi:conserved membrane protein of unknown function [Hyphomicrobium sp. 1Nfss2.1]|uniref:hypothetical protein n=1 Tax=Hyphomicrobium sp. 1Nfss2.1 TaxID=3413936 RepID=UPI003C7D4CA4
MAQVISTARPQGSTSASLIVMLLVAAAVGAIVGRLIGYSTNPAVLAMVAGFVATIAAVVVRNKLLNRVAGVGPDDFRIPMVVVVYSAIASIAGSLAGKELLDQAGGNFAPEWVGTVAGLGSAILMSFLMITYYMNPQCRS